MTSLLVAVSDDGVGGAGPQSGSGLAGLTDRVATDGGLKVASEPGHGRLAGCRTPSSGLSDAPST